MFIFCDILRSECWHHVMFTLCKAILCSSTPKMASCYWKSSETNPPWLYTILVTFKFLHTVELWEWTLDKYLIFFPKVRKHLFTVLWSLIRWRPRSFRLSQIRYFSRCVSPLTGIIGNSVYPHLWISPFSNYPLHPFAVSQNNVNLHSRSLSYPFLHLSWARICKSFKEPRNRFHGIDSASLCNLSPYL